jgi:hypothetical protein
MSTSSFRARELEALRMELRRELRMEANVFAEDDDFDATDDDDGDDAVVGTPARSRAARRLTSASKRTSRPSSRAFESPSRSLRVNDFKDALSPMRGLGSAPVAEKEKKGRPAPSRRRRDVDVVATPTRSEAPPARSALLSDRLVLAPPSATRGRDRARPEFSERRERLRSPSLERLAGTYRSLGALATAATFQTPAKGEGSAKVSVSARGSVSVSSSAAKKSASASINGRARYVSAKTSFAHRGGRDVKDARPVSRSRSLEAERAPSRDARRGKDTAEKDATRKDAERRGKTCSASVPKPKSLPGTKLDAKKPVTVPADHEARPERRREPHGNPTRWRVVVEYDLNGRRVERKTLAPPPSARGRPAWSSATRPGTSSGPAASRSVTAKHKNETASKALRPATSAGVSRPASRPAFDPGPGGLGIDHRATTEKFSRASKYAFLTPRRERHADASRRVRSPETRSPVRYRRATTPSPAPPRRRRETRETRETCFSSDDDERNEEKPRRRRVDATSEPSRSSASTESGSELEFGSELDSERDVDEGGRKRAKERRATRDGDGDGGVFGRNPKHPKHPNHPNPFVDVRDAAGDDSDSEAVFFSSTGLGTGGAIRERFVGDSGRPATARSRVRTPSTSGRRAALGGFEGYGSAFGYRSHARRSHSSSLDARRPYTADTAVPRRDENEARCYFDSNDSNGESSSFDDIINRAFGMAHAPSPSRFAERRRGVTTEAFSAYGGDYSGNRAGIADRRPHYEQNSAYYEPQPQPQPQPLHPFYPHHDAYAYGQQPLPASYAAAPNAGAPAYGPPHPSGDAYSSRDAWYRAAPPPTGAAASFQRWSHSTGVGGGWGYY